MKTTEFRKTQDNTFVRVTYGLDHHGDQAPYFSITMDEYKQRRVNERELLSAGLQHGLVRELFPELAPLIRWHLTSTDGPMHYLANGLYWYDCHHGKQKHARPEDKERAPDAFAHTVVLGALSDDMELTLLLALSRNEVEAYLKARLPRLLAAFQADIRAAGLTSE
jgi:hypothetical protein